MPEEGLEHAAHGKMRFELPSMERGAVMQFLFGEHEDARLLFNVAGCCLLPTAYCLLTRAERCHYHMVPG